MTTRFIDAFSEENWINTYKNYKDNNVDDTFKRVATAIASVETTEEKRLEWEEKFLDMLTDFKGTAGGRSYSNAGTEWTGTTLINCFVAPRTGTDLDSLDQIINDLKNQTFTLKSEGGWGQNFSWIRPRGTFIHGIGVDTPGAVKFMELYDKASEIITSGAGKKSKHHKAKGKIRKGAMMGVLDITHPDIIEFITAKQQAGRLTKFNISVNCTDEFMNKLIKIQELKDAGQPFEEEDKWVLRFPDTTCPAYKPQWDGNLTVWEGKGLPVVEYQTISATWLWNLIMESTYNRAEPGVLFLDRANDYNPANYLEHISATNPCGEQTLAPGGVCCLGSLNLTQYVKPSGEFDFAKFEKYTAYMVRFLDNVNEYSDAPLPEYVDSMRNKRRVGVGIMGWGSMLLMMKIKFGSKKAGQLRDKMMKMLAQTTYKASIDLAVEKGMFKYCDPVKHAAGKFVNSLDMPAEYMEKLRTTGIRNSSLISVQPTGNTAIVANIVSGGLEPIFMPEYIRTVIVNNMPPEIADVTPKWFEGEWFETSMFKFTKEGDEEILRGEHNGTVYKIDKNRGLLKEVECKDYAVRYLEGKNEWDPTADYVATALSGLTAEDHLTDLIGFTRYIDAAASKTINLPFEYSFDMFKDIYMTCYKAEHVKGVTTYRSGTMTAVLSSKENSTNGYDEEVILDSVKMNNSSEATMKVLTAEGRKWYMTVVWNETKTRPFALFVQTNHSEKTVTTHDAIDRMLELGKVKGIPESFLSDVKEKVATDNNATKITRVLSLLLRHGVSIKNIVKTLEQIDNVIVGSFLFQIKKYLSSFIKDGEKVEDEKCLECGAATVVYQEGCKVCITCGSSKCG
jgi:ribonucleoside-diphosphate reductase alpha chain